MTMCKQDLINPTIHKWKHRNKNIGIDKNNVFLIIKDMVARDRKNLIQTYKANPQNVCDEICIYVLLLTMKANYYFVNSITHDMSRKMLTKCVLDYTIKN